MGVSASTSTDMDLPPGLKQAEHFDLSPDQAEDLIDTMPNEEDAKTAEYDKPLPYVKIDQIFGADEQMPPAEAEGFTLKRMKVSMDSGSHVDVVPEGELPQLKVKPFSGARKGRRMVAANGTPIPESGEKRIQATTDDGMDVDWPFIAGGGKKALKSAAITCDEANGHWVIHTSRGGWIVDVKTRKKMAFTREGNGYVLYLWLKAPNGRKIKTSVEGAESGFIRLSAPRGIAVSL